MQSQAVYETGPVKLVAELVNTILRLLLLLLLLFNVFVSPDQSLISSTYLHRTDDAIIIAFIRTDLIMRACRVRERGRCLWREDKRRDQPVKSI